MQEIMLMAAASAKSTETKNIVKQSPAPSPMPSRPSSPLAATENIASSQALCFPAKKSSVCRLQGVNFLIIILELDDNLLTDYVFEYSETVYNCPCFS